MFNAEIYVLVLDEIYSRNEWSANKTDFDRERF